MLAVRLTLVGPTGLHQRLHVDSERFIAELRNLAAERGGDRMWIEQVELRTEPPRQTVILEGPFQELIDTLRSVSVRSRCDECRGHRACRAETPAAGGARQ